MGNFQDTLCACKRVSTRSRKPYSPALLDNYEQNKTKKFLHTFADIAKETPCEKIRRKETLLEVFVSLHKKTDFGKSLSKIICIIFSLQNQYNHITRKCVLISKIYFKVYTNRNYCSRSFLDLLILY